MQKLDGKARSHFKSNAKGIPVYDRVALPHSPSGRGIPHAVLMDHEGKVVATGHTSKLIPKVAKLIDAVPKPIPPILGTVRAKHCKREAKKLADGDPVKDILEDLEEDAKKDSEKGVEARVIIKAVTASLDKRMQRLKDQLKEKPGQTLLDLEDFCKLTEGVDAYDYAHKLQKALQKEEAVKTVASTIDLIAEGRKRKSSFRLRRARQKLEKVIEAEDTPGPVKAEAEALLEDL